MPRNVNLGNGRFAMFNKERDISVRDPKDSQVRLHRASSDEKFRHREAADDQVISVDVSTVAP